MLKKGFAFLIPLLLVLSGLVALNVISLQPYSPCLPYVSSCSLGYSCQMSGISIPVCKPTAGFGNELLRFLGLFSITNIIGTLCGNFACSFLVGVLFPFLTGIILAIAFGLVALYFGVPPNFLAYTLGGGFIIGFVLSSLVNYWWWVALLIAGLLLFAKAKK